MDIEKVGAVLVCGAGIAGIQASLDLADSGFKVYLLEHTAAIGGRMAQLDKAYPTGDCSMCILSPRLVECARNRNIEIITLADLESVSGEPGNFKVKIRQNPRYIDARKCDACGDCSAVCPVSLSSEFDCGMGEKKAVSLPYPQAIPGIFSISKAQGQVPCRSLCPAGVNVPGFVALVAAGKFKEAFELIRLRCSLPAVSGRICRHSCQDKCNRGEVDESVSIRHLERYVADYVQQNPDQYPERSGSVIASGKRVAIIGSGPAGLTAASDLSLMGYGVTLFEAKPQLGGMLRYGIPEYRLPKEILDRDVRHILELGVEVRTNTPIEKPGDLLKSRQADGASANAADFDAVFVSTGAWQSLKPGIPGEDAGGVWEGLKFLYAVNSGSSFEIGPEVLVIGGSALAIDTARCALRVPGVKSVQLACLENAGELRAGTDHVAEAIAEGIEIHYSLGPTTVNAKDSRVSSVRFRACTSLYDEYKRFDPLFDDSSIRTISADTVIIASGRAVDAKGFGLEMRPGGRILADKDTLATGVRGVFAGGDAVLGPASMVDAMAHGHKAAASIDAFIRGSASIRSMSKASAGDTASTASVHFAHNPKPWVSKQSHSPIARAKESSRPQDHSEIFLGYSHDAAIAEAKLCLACGLCSECLLCVKACSADALVHDQQATSLEVEVGSIILAPGVEELESAAARKFGLGKYANVVSGLQFERMLAAAGPSGRLHRHSDAGEVRSIAFIQCVGGREGDADYCSSICCMNTAKAALGALERSAAGAMEVTIFCREVRSFGKESDAYIRRAKQENGLHYLRAVPSNLWETGETGRLKIAWPGKDGVSEQEFDLVVLSTGAQVSAGARDMASRIGLQLNSFGFVQTDRMSPFATSRPGIFVAGSFQEPKDISESVAQASGAAACSMSLLTAVRGTMTRRHEYPWERDVADESPRIGVFVCRCGHNIADVVDVELVASKAAKMPGVCHAEVSTYTCSDTNQQHIRSLIRKHRLNRLVVASCSSRTHEMLFRETLRESGLNQYLFAMTNIRDQCSWVHKDNPLEATAKAVDLVSMAIARARLLRAFPLHELEVTASALIIGGGLAGMTSALNLADQGFKVHLVEREPALGGQLRNLQSDLERDNIQDELKVLVSRVSYHPNVTVHRNSILVRTSGQVGNFVSVLSAAGKEQTVKHGVVIVATGGRERSTTRFLCGDDSRVVTQRALESALSGGNLPSELTGKKAPSVVMIQCVDSRNADNPYCSRVCCSEAIKNALELKRRRPDADIAILNRDIHTYGSRDDYFRQARNKGIQFVRYSESREPLVANESGVLQVRVTENDTGRELAYHPDLLVLSTGIAPDAGNADIAGILRCALTAEGFFLEAHPKLRPVDLANEGEFVCGLAHSPRFMDETIAQAHAVAGRAARILSKTQMEIVGQVSYVEPANCVACATCVKICPYGAPMINALGKSEIQAAKCMGCGSCVAACPARAMALQHQEGSTMIAMLDEMRASGGLE